MLCPTYSQLARALGAQPELHPKEIPALWTRVVETTECIVEVGGGVGDTTLLLIAGSPQSVRVYSWWNDAPYPEKVAFSAVNTGILSLGMWPQTVADRFAYMLGDARPIAAQWQRPIDLIVLRGEGIAEILSAVQPCLKQGAYIVLLESTSFNGRAESIALAKHLETTARLPVVHVAHAMSIFRWGATDE